MRQKRERDRERRRKKKREDARKYDAICPSSNPHIWHKRMSQEQIDRQTMMRDMGIYIYIYISVAYVFYYI